MHTPGKVDPANNTQNSTDKLTDTLPSPPANPNHSTPSTLPNREAEMKLVSAARNVTVNGIPMGATDVDVVVTGNLVDAVLKVDSRNATTKAAYLGKMMMVARNVVNAGMKLDGIQRVHIIIESDGAFGTGGVAKPL